MVCARSQTSKGMIMKNNTSDKFLHRVATDLLNRFGNDLQHVAIVFNNKRVALEVNGETYHAEGIIPNEMFDDNLNRQNEILNAGWFLLRYSYSQLQHPEWRTRVAESLFFLLRSKKCIRGS